MLYQLSVAVNATLPSTAFLSDIASPGFRHVTSSVKAQSRKYSNVYDPVIPLCFLVRNALDD